MSIVDLYGHERLREQIAGAISRDALPSSMLFHGPRGVGKQRLALWLGQALLCTGTTPRPCGGCSQCRFSLALTHPDLQWVFPRPRLKDSDPSREDVRDDYAQAIAERTAKNGLYTPPSGSDGIFVATMRAVVRAAAMSPALAHRKVANAFLKLLEEPPADTTLILTSSEPGALLPTIRSRVVSIRVPTLPDRDVRAFVSDPLVVAYLKAERSKASINELIRFSGGAPGRVLASASLRDAELQAERMFEAATSSDRGLRYRVALGQGAARARGSFTDALNALEVLLHERARDAASAGNDSLAAGTARALEVVERAKEKAAGNVNPQLLTAGLLRELAGLVK